MSGKTSLLVCVSFIKAEGEKNKKGEVKSEDMRKKLICLMCSRCILKRSGNISALISM